jgi:hypothetical protein
MESIYGYKIKKPREKHEAHKAKPFLAKGEGCGGLRGCPDLRLFADHSGGTVADFHGLPRFPNLLIVKVSLWRGKTSVNTGYFAAAQQFGLQIQKSCPPEKKRRPTANVSVFVEASRSHVLRDGEGTRSLDGENAFPLAILK